MNKKYLKIAVVFVVFFLLMIFFGSDAGKYFSLDYLNSHKNALVDHFHVRPFVTAMGYFVLYIVATALSLPGAVILTLAGGRSLAFSRALSWYPLPVPSGRPWLFWYPGFCFGT
jgi:uncharacterized membrane protein YdjX (TVP38/TMEM64 family)